MRVRFSQGPPALARRGNGRTEIVGFSFLGGEMENVPFEVESHLALESFSPRRRRVHKQVYAGPGPALKASGSLSFGLCLHEPLLPHVELGGLCNPG